MTDDKFEIYTGPVSKMKQSPWLDADCFELGKPVRVTVEHVRVRHQVKGPDGRVTPEAYFLKFKDRDKELWLNGVNRKCMAAMFGPLVVNWQGKEIELVKVDKVRNPKGGETVCGIRIRPVP